jgi:hypothetical protein
MKAASKHSATTTSAVKFEKSSVPAIVLEKLNVPPDAFDEFHVVTTGTGLAGTYRVKYQPKPGSTVVVEPGTYDVVARTTGGGTFLLVGNVEVKDGTTATINPNAVLGSIVVDPLTQKGFPEIKQIIVFDAGTSGHRLIRQRTESPEPRYQSLPVLTMWNAGPRAAVSSLS